MTASSMQEQLDSVRDALRKSDEATSDQSGALHSALPEAASTASQDAIASVEGRAAASFVPPADTLSSTGEAIANGATPIPAEDAAHAPVDKPATSSPLGSTQEVASLPTQIGSTSPDNDDPVMPQETPIPTGNSVIDTKPRFTVIKGAIEADIENAAPSTILLFGNGFQLKVVSEKAKYFQLRYCLGRNSTRNLGKYPEMKYPQALVEAEKCRTEVKLARQKKRMAEFKVRLKKPSLKKESGSAKHDTVPSFLSMQHAGQFLHNLSAAHWLKEEIRFYILLQILIPSRPSDLLVAQWNMLLDATAPRFAGVTQWTIKPWKITSKNKWGHPTQIAYLSQNAKLALNELRKLNSPGNDDSQSPIFPNLFKMQKSDRDAEIAQAVQKLWPNYPIELDELRFFFRDMAYKNSGFKPELIDAMMAHKAGNDDNLTYINNMHSIADWWSSELKRHTENVQYRPGSI